MLMFGCISSGPSGGTPAGNEGPEETPTPCLECQGTPAPGETPPEATPAPLREAFSAKEGLGEARAAVAWKRADAELVAVSASCNGAGVCSGWDYTFDSYSSHKSYVATVPGSPQDSRETGFVFSGALGDAWVDSTRASQACGASSGDFSLEETGGKLIWTVVPDGGDACEVDASTGERMGGTG